LELLLPAEGEVEAFFGPGFLENKGKSKDVFIVVL